MNFSFSTVFGQCLSLAFECREDLLLDQQRLSDQSSFQSFICHSNPQARLYNLTIVTNYGSNIVGQHLLDRKQTILLKNVIKRGVLDVPTLMN